MKDDEFVAHVTRLELASEVLRSRDCLLHAVARKYYVVYAYAMQAAQRHHVTFRRGTDIDGERRLTHLALPALVRALYSGQNVGPILGGGPRRFANRTIDGRDSSRVC